MVAQAIQVHDNRFDVFTSRLTQVELADDKSCAVLTIPLMHVGPNKKGLYWTPKMLKSVAPMFRGITFRYDLNGSEGSSHTPQKLSSPHFDIGWTYSDERGAWFEKDNGILWVKGEVTHPDIIKKLDRKTSDGKREINFASMGVLVEKSVCSICGKEHGMDGCEHTRNEIYDGEVCYSVPEKVKKALHVALTNDPADGEAEIEECIFQEWNMSPNENIGQGGSNMNSVSNSFAGNQVQNQIPGGLAPSSNLNQGFQQGPAPSSEEILKDMAERIKTIEQQMAQDKLNADQQMAPTPELINQNQNAGATQDNMGVSSQFAEDEKMDKKDGQYTNEKAPMNPSDKKIKAEMQDFGQAPQEQQGQPQMGGAEAKLDQILQMLQQLVGGAGVQTQDMGQESLKAGKGMAKKSQDDIPLDHMGEGAVGEKEDSGNAKNKIAMKKPDQVMSADDEVVEKLKTELADMKTEMEKLKTAKVEFQDQNIPEFGGPSVATAETADDLSASQRREEFGDYGKWDSIFHGADSAERFKK